MGDVRLVIHGHFYQPPRENPWTEVVPVEPSAAPFHDWNERITAECYRPNGWARVVDERGRVTAIVDNYEYLSFNLGPTLLSWLETHAPDAYARILAADTRSGGATAQAYNHLILPLANERDIRTQVRWGLADFAARFGRPAEGMWLPEAAVNDTVLRVLAEEGVRFTILAPDQAAAVRPLDADEDAWEDVTGGRVTTGPPHRWKHPDDGHRGLDVVFYDGPLSHDMAFALTGLSTQELIRRAQETGADGTPVVIATDGETFGHHHKYADRTLAYAFDHEAAANGVRVINTATLVREQPPTHEVRVRESSWSCAHGIERWRSDCGCSTGGEPGWNQQWRAPLREALDVVRDHGVAVFERRGREVLRDPWAARDAYIEVVLGRRSIDEFLADQVIEGLDEGGTVVALTLLEAQRHSLLMYTSCGWFFNDLAGIETLQVLRYAARTIDLLAEIGEDAPVDAFLDILARAQSNDPDEGDGRAVWDMHVIPTRVDAGRVVSHLALVDLLEDREATAAIAGYDVAEHTHEHRDRGGLSGCAGRVTLVHRRTRRRTTHDYAAIHLGGFEVFGAVRPLVDGDGAAERFVELAGAVERGERVTTLLRLIVDGFGPREFGLESALPDAAHEILSSAASALVDRFGATFSQLYSDNRTRYDALLTAGYPLPPELRMPAEFAFARRFEAEIQAISDLTDPGAFRAARAVIQEARAAGLQLATPSAAAAMERAVVATVTAAVAEADIAHVDAALGLLRLTRELGLGIDLSRAQEIVWDALPSAGDTPLRRLAAALGLAVT